MKHTCLNSAKKGKSVAWTRHSAAGWSTHTIHDALLYASLFICHTSFSQKQSICIQLTVLAVMLWNPWQSNYDLDVQHNNGEHAWLCFLHFGEVGYSTCFPFQINSSSTVSWLPGGEGMSSEGGANWMNPTRGDQIKLLLVQQSRRSWAFYCSINVGLKKKEFSANLLAQTIAKSYRMWLFFF